MIKVIIVRRVKAGKESELDVALRELRAKGMYQPGYISGETLRGLDDSSLILVVSTWASAGAWKCWERSAKRQEVTAKIDPLLAEPPRTIIFAMAGDKEGAAP
jgi:heme-degrading monooxygenase HmoA